MEIVKEDENEIKDEINQPVVIKKENNNEGVGTNEQLIVSPVVIKKQPVKKESAFEFKLGIINR